MRQSDVIGQAILQKVGRHFFGESQLIHELEDELPQKRLRTCPDAHLVKAPLGRPVAAKRRNPFANLSNKLN